MTDDIDYEDTAAVEAAWRKRNQRPAPPRRDHAPNPGATRQGVTLCMDCGERLRLVMGYGVPDYWRHWRRS